MNSVQLLARQFYPDLAGRWDDEIFRHTILGFLRPQHRVLDLGAGRGAVPQMNLREVAGEVCGVDPTADVLLNPYLHEAKTGTAENIPYEDRAFDAVISNNVLEHLPDPLAAFKEIRRVLKPDGIFAAKTPNRFHYVPLVSALTPYQFHRWYHQSLGNNPDDIFPTRYLVNSRRAQRKAAHEAGLEVISIQSYEGRPDYLRWNPLAYLLGIAYERVVGSVEALAFLRVILVSMFRKPQD